MNAVFDLGNVLLRWDPRFLYRKIFADEARMEWFLSNICDMDWVLAQDKRQSFKEGIVLSKARYPDFTDALEAFDARWHEALPGPIDETVAILHELEERGVPLYAITNFNGEKFAETRERFPFLAKFRDVVVSGEEQMLKPEPQIYNLLLARNRLAAHECVFIDDNAVNVKGAEAVGMAGHHFTSAQELRTALTAHGLL
jgi:2-haloacid dehalogenase